MNEQNRLNEEPTAASLCCPLCRHNLEPGVDAQGNAIQICAGCGVGWIPVEEFCHLLDDLVVDQDSLLP